MNYHTHQRSSFAHLVDADYNPNKMTPKQAEHDSHWLREKREREAAVAAPPISEPWHHPRRQRYPRPSGRPSSRSAGRTADRCRPSAT